MSQHAPPAGVARRSALIKPDERMSTPAADDPRPFDVAGFEGGRRLAIADPPDVPENGPTHFSVTDQYGGADDRREGTVIGLPR